MDKHAMGKYGSILLEKDTKPANKNQEPVGRLWF
jgi:hypothetical protein